MSKIKINQVGDNEIEVRMDGSVPLEMAEQLAKSLEARGLAEDKTKSSLTQRYYFRPEDTTVEVADELIKSLSRLVKSDTWWAKDPAQRKAFATQQERIRVQERQKASRAASVPMAPHQSESPSPAATTPAPKGPATLPGVPNKLHNPRFQKEEMHKEDDPKCMCMKCDAARKMNLNKSIKERLSGKSWGQHLPFPSANDGSKLSKSLPTNEEVMAQQLADMMAGKNMMKAIPGAPLDGSAVPPQPTNEQLFGHLIPSEQELAKMDRQYSNGLNDFFAEASKPISSRFNSEEEEMAYWRSLSVNPKASAVD